MRQWWCRTPPSPTHTKLVVLVVGHCIRHQGGLLSKPSEAYPVADGEGSQDRERRQKAGVALCRRLP